MSISAIAVAGVFLLAVVAFVVYVLFFKKRKPRSEERKTRSEQISDELRTLESTRGRGYQDYESVIDSYNKEKRELQEQLQLQQSTQSHLPTN